MWHVATFGRGMLRRVPHVTGRRKQETPDGLHLHAHARTTGRSRIVSISFELIEPLGLKHVGFKDVGVPCRRRCSALTKAIHASGRHLLHGGRLDDPRGLPHLGTRRASTSASSGCSAEPMSTPSCRSLDGTGTGLLPVPGQARRPSDQARRQRPTTSRRDCRAFVAKGCAGCDLLAYRATEADPLELVRAARRGLGPDKQLIVAGAVDLGGPGQGHRRRRRRCLHHRHRCFRRLLFAAKGSILSQLRDVLADCGRSEALWRSSASISARKA